MKLISMVEFVLQQDADPVLGYYKYEIKKIHSYANFLTQPLELWMFVPCTDEGLPMDEPQQDSYRYNDTYGAWDEDRFNEAVNAYKAAKERCLFEGFTLNKTLQPVIVTNKYSDMELPFYFRKDGSTWIYQNDCADKPKKYAVQDLLEMNLWLPITLTPTAINQIQEQNKELVEALQDVWFMLTQDRDKDLILPVVREALQKRKQ